MYCNLQHGIKSEEYLQMSKVRQFVEVSDLIDVILLECKKLQDKNK